MPASPKDKCSSFTTLLRRRYNSSTLKPPYFTTKRDLVIIYKYGSMYVKKTLTDQQIKVSQASELNDPFELSPSVDPKKFTPNIARQVLKQEHNIQEHYENEGRQLGFTKKKHYKAHYLKTLDDRVRALMPNVPKNVESARDNFAQTFSKRWRLFCASKRRDAILMWSHYAAEHKGIAIGYDAGKPPFSDVGAKYSVCVDYADEKPDFFFQPNNLQNFENAMRKVVGTKSSDWRYEEEVRYMFPVTACIGGSLIPFPAETVVCLIFGARMPVADRDPYLALLSEIRYLHVEIYAAKLSKERYALEFEPLREGNMEGPRWGLAL